MNFLTEVATSVRDFVLPHDCILCEQETTEGVICNNCCEYLPRVQSPLCPCCGRPVKKERLCRFCRTQHLIDHGRAWLVFIPPVDILLHHFKYVKKTKLSRLLGRALATIITADHILNQADCVVPVPLHWWKTLQRGYNQALLLSRVIEENCALPTHEILRRTRYTRTQTWLQATARRTNVAGAFEVKTDSVEGKKIVLIDDVLTTGATINECARILKEAGAREVYSCVAAITP